FSPTSENCSRGIKCVGDVNGPCPQELRDPSGCNNPCTMFTNNQFCCTTGSRCEATHYSKFFKTICPDALTYPNDWSSNTCPSRSSYNVVFCPNVSSDSQNAIFKITNSCPFVVWPATFPGGGRQLLPRETWDLSVACGIACRIWARTGCEFDSNGRAQCETGDSGGVLQCQSSSSQPLNTLAEFSINMTNNMDLFDISLVDGFNVAMNFSSTSTKCTRGTKCVASINDQCPLFPTPGGCNNPCTVYKTYRTCGPMSLSKFFKESCPDAYSYPTDDDRISTFTCPSGTKYKVVLICWFFHYMCVIYNLR
ncbi:hypothetical protein UlMin_001950, partial [Ulmus minor]